MTLSREYEHDELEMFWRMWRKVTAGSALTFGEGEVGHSKAFLHLSDRSQDSARQHVACHVAAAGTASSMQSTAATCVTRRSVEAAVFLRQSAVFLPRLSPPSERDNREASRVISLSRSSLDP